MGHRPPGAVIGAEFSPIPPGSLVWLWEPMTGAWSRRRLLAGPDAPGPHLMPGLSSPRWQVADLQDRDTALLVLRRLASHRSAPVRAFALSQQALTGRWDLHQAVDLGTLCARVWGSDSTVGVSRVA